MPLGSESLRVAIAGATSLLGKDLKQCFDESGFPVGDVKLFDEELVAGTLTELGDEPAVVQQIDESSFDRMRFVFFTGSPVFSSTHAAAVERAGATVIDLSSGLVGASGARLLIPHLDAVAGASAGSALDAAPAERISVCVSPSAPSIVACSLAMALREFHVTRMNVTFLLPVSERGAAGIKELESQTVNLLSLQPIPQDVFDAQVAFNVLDRWGAESPARFSDARMRVAHEVQAYLANRATVPAIAFLQAPIFFGCGFMAYAEFASAPDQAALLQRLEAAGFQVAAGDDPRPSTLASAGEVRALIGAPEADSNVPGGFWFWGAADNLRLATMNAVRIAERLLVA